MNSFSIKGDSSYISIAFDEVYNFPEKTSHFGGYDVRTTLEIKSGNFKVKSILWTSTGEIHTFLQQLKVCNAKLNGVASYDSYEGNLHITATYNNHGHVKIKGEFSEQNELDNLLQFEFISDQSYISSSINELELIADKYGDMQGVKNNK